MSVLPMIDMMEATRLTREGRLGKLWPSCAERFMALLHPRPISRTTRARIRTVPHLQFSTWSRHRRPPEVRGRYRNLARRTSFLVARA